MGSFSIWHWLILLIIIVLVGYPYSRIFRKAGFSAWWTILIFVPLINLITLWVFSFVDWPAKVPSAAAPLR